jgi:3-hydroxy-9,10-secoandrosta-1,3,5(10)-triene-9,17-dione monooxygenase
MVDAKDAKFVGCAPTFQAADKSAGPARLEIRYPGDDLWLSPAELSEITSHRVLVERVKALKPLIAANAAACELSRRPVPVVWDALRKTGLFYHFVPKRYGGLEFDIESFIDVMLPIGEACASTCWTTVFSTDHNWLMAHFSEKAQDEFFGGCRYTIAPGTSLAVKPSPAKRVPGGYRLSGQFRFGSAIMDSNWTLLQTWVENEDVGETLRWMAIPSTEVTALDTWYMDGLAGTGSNDILVEDVFIPEYRTVKWVDIMAGNSPGSKIHSNPMYMVTPIQFLAFNTTIPPLAATRGLVDMYRDRMGDRRRYGAANAQCTKATIQVRLARADLLTRSGEMGLRDVARTLSENARLKLVPGETERLRLLAQCAHATELMYEASNLIAVGTGSSIHALSNPMQRMIRDITVAKSHQLHELDELAEHYGRSLFGLERTTLVY